ncbi:MAG TPA: carboxypeptidase-like regulatory domain-containing protein, partial [Thermoanaerobaculia bacterium]
SAPKTLGKSTVTFTGLAEGLYVVMATGPQPLQRLSAKANVGANGNSLRLVLPKGRTSLHVTLAGQPVPRAALTLTQDELRWSTDLETGDDGGFEGALWEPGVYTASVRQDRTAAPHIVDVTLSAKPLAIDVPDREVTGHVLGADGKPIAGAIVILQSQDERSTLSVRTTSAPDGRFAFFGVREGAQSLSARAPSYLNSDAVPFELHSPSAHHSADLELMHGIQQAVRLVDARGGPIADASLFTTCEGQIKATTLTNAEGRAQVALSDAGSCAVYALPKEGSIAVGRISGREPLVLRVPDGSSSLRLALQSENGELFSDLWLLMRIDGSVVPPAIARQLASRGLALVTDTAGSISLSHIPPGTYEFWPYRTEAEGQMLYEVASDAEAPISLKVLTGENNATVRFQARR